MLSPEISLLIGLVILALLAFFFLPDKGFWFRYRKRKRQSKRVLIEDALKHIYDCEYQNSFSSLDRIAGYLGISRDNAADLITKLNEMELITGSNDMIELTAAGRSYALRVVRIHRIWERYLADETSVEAEDWHMVAEVLEHDVSGDKINELAAKLGNPVFDPHGDPIPTAEGTIPPQQGISLRSLKPNEAGRILHIEDEPDTIYAQLIAEGLHVGMQVRMLESNSQRVSFIADNNECVIAPLFADNIHIKRIEREDIIEDFQTLDTIDSGKKCEVVGISNAIRGQHRRRLMDMGIVPGSVIGVEMKSISGNPTAYRVRGALIALRKNQAKNIYVKTISEKERVK